MKIHPLIRALKTMSPAAEFSLTSSRHWCSMTFSGEQLVIECVAALDHNLTQNLPQHEFELPKMLVADIIVASSEQIGDVVKMSIEALVLEA